MPGELFGSLPVISYLSGERIDILITTNIIDRLKNEFKIGKSIWDRSSRKHLLHPPAFCGSTLY
jgi:hypothetical protein